MRGLVVDPSATTARILARALRQVGCTEVATAGTLDGARALCAPGKTELRVVVTEWDLPDGKGIDLVRELKASASPDAAPADLCVVVVTVRNSRADVRKAIAAGADGYILKPFTMETLRERVELVLASRLKEAA